MSLSALLDEHPLVGEDPLLHDTMHAVTAAETRAAVAAVAGQLADLGVGPGVPVAVRHSRSIDTVVSMFGVWTRNAVFVPVNPHLPEAAVGRLIDSIDPAAMIDDDGVRARSSATTHGPGTAFVLWTSGTTGQPKPVLHTHTAYLELIDRVLEPLRGQGRDRAAAPSPNLIPVSMALNAGIYNALFGLRAGAPLVMMDRFDTTDFATLVSRHQIRSSVLPPAAMVMLCDDEAVTELTPLRYVRSITAPLSPFQARRFTDRFGVTVLNGYGQAEIGEVVGWTAADAREHPHKIGAVGRPHPGVDLRLVDPDDDGIGALLVRPPNRASGYADGSELDDRLTSDGFVHTGDLARIDAEGFVWIEGRLGDLINRGGHKVFPDEVEEVLRSVPGVSDAAVAARSDDRLGQVPVAHVVAADSVTDAELDRTCRTHLAPYKVPVEYRRVDTVPRSEVGKILRRELAG